MIPIEALDVVPGGSFTKDYDHGKKGCEGESCFIALGELKNVQFKKTDRTYHEDPILLCTSCRRRKHGAWRYYKER